MPKEQTKDGTLKVWWIPQVPMKAFEVLVPDLRTARLMLDTLARYDQFQFDNKVKPDYCNTGGLMVYDKDAGDWQDFATEMGDDFKDLDDEAIQELDARLGRGDKVWS